MPFEKFDLENLDKERRKAVANSIRTMSVEELKALGNEIFRYADDPWREKFFRFIAENPGATFHHAVMSDGVNIVYCRDQDKGMCRTPLGRNDCTSSEQWLENTAVENPGARIIYIHCS